MCKKKTLAEIVDILCKKYYSCFTKLILNFISEQANFLKSNSFIQIFSLSAL
jgi:hypothetical protein